MEITIENIGPLQKAKIVLEGLTVIAGENDTGKSTIGKTIFSLIKVNQMAMAKSNNFSASMLSEQHKDIMNTIISLVFDSQISQAGKIKVQQEGSPICQIEFSQHQCLHFKSFEPHLSHFLQEATFIQTPFIWDMIDFFDAVLRLKQSREITQGIHFSIKYPYIFWDTYLKIITTPIKKNIHKTNELVKNIDQIIRGHFEQHENKLVFQRADESIALINVAAGIKYFGILQRLAENNQLNSSHLLIFDEPENHLHPEWQLLFAQLIVNLVLKHKVYVLINSHSPYMIEALKVYSDQSINDKTHFYFNQIHHEQIEVQEITEDLSLIFEKLSLPFQKLEKTALGM
jgi:predicted ATPase